MKFMPPRPPEHPANAPQIHITPKPPAPSKK